MDFIIDAIVEWLKGLLVDGIMAVSYTHLDVYQRQAFQTGAAGVFRLGV